MEIETLSRRRLALLCALACGAVVAPFALSDYVVFQLAMVLVYAIALLGLNMLTGYGGQISLGHGAFFALGAYCSAMLMTAGWPYWASVPGAAVLCLIAGFLFGLPALRLAGHHLALATFALALAVPQLLKHKQLEKFTGGVQGIVIDKPEPPFANILGQAMSSDRWLYLLTLAIAIVMFSVAWNILRGRFGRALVALRDQPTAAASMGVDLAHYKSVTFGISALYTGVAGAMSSLLVSYIAPDSFSFFLSLSLVIGIVIGGLGSISGALFGAVVIQFVPNFADSISKAAPWAIYGVVLLVCTFLLPRGMSGAIAALREKTGWPRKSS